MIDEDRVSRGADLVERKNSGNRRRSTDSDNMAGGERLRILQVIPYFAPKWGGDVNVCYTISRNLAKRGHSVTIVTTDLGFDHLYSKSIENDGVRVLSFPCVSTLGFYLISPRMKNWLEENVGSFEIVHLHNARSYQNHIAVHYARKFHVPYVIQAHGSLERVGGKRALKGLYDFVYGSSIMKHADRFLAVSELESEQYKRLTTDGTRIELVPNCLESERYKTLPEHGQFRRKYGLTSEEIVLYQGRIHRTKNIDSLIRGFDIVRKERPNAILIVAGPGFGYERNLRAMVRRLGLIKSVRFVGFVENPLEAYVDADLLVNPRVDEIFGLVPLEAAMCGTPVIVSDKCGTAPLVSKSGCGRVVDTANPKVLARMIIEMLSIKGVSNDGAAKAKEALQQNLGCDTVLDRLEEVYRDCVHRT